MSWFTFLVTFIIVWWIVLFMALPVGIKHGDKKVEGQDAGAPKNPNLKIKMLVTTVIALVLSFVIEYSLTGLSLSDL